MKAQIVINGVLTEVEGTPEEITRLIELNNNQYTYIPAPPTPVIPIWQVPAPPYLTCDGTNEHQIN
jgi:hypothetical protein